ncbi:hypothetical protein Tco_0633029 [Tanacetum coccineum]
MQSFKQDPNGISLSLLRQLSWSHRALASPEDDSRKGQHKVGELVDSEEDVSEFQWVSDDELEASKEASQFLEQTPPSPNYVPRPEHPPSPNYVPGPDHLPSPDYVLGPEYPEYLVPSDDEVPIEDQPLLIDVSPIALSPGYVADSDPLEEDSDEDPKEDPAEYPTDEEEDDDDDNDDDDDDDEEEEDEEDEEHLAPADSNTLHAIDLSSQLRIQRHSRQKTATEVLIVAVAAALPLSSPPPSPLTPLSSLLPQIPSPPLPLSSPPTYTSPTYAEAPLGYKAAMIRSSAASPLPLLVPSSTLLLPAIDHTEDVPEADVPPQKRLCLTAPAPRFKVGESSAAVVARQPGLDVTHATDYNFVNTVDDTPGHPMSREAGYGITDVWGDMVWDIEGRALTTLEELIERVTDLATTLAWDTHEMYVRLEDAQDDRALQRARVNTLYRDRRYNLHTSMLLESEARSVYYKDRGLRTKEPENQSPLEIQSLRMEQLMLKMPPTRTTTTTTPMTDAQIKALIAQGVATALAKYEAYRNNGNGNDSHESGSGKRIERAARKYTYSDFLKCQPLNSRVLKELLV